MTKRFLQLCGLIYCFGISQVNAQNIPQPVINAIYSFEETGKNSQLDSLLSSKKEIELTALDLYHLSYHAVVNVKNDSLFKVYSSKIFYLKSNYRSATENLLTIGTKLLEDRLAEKFYSKYELNSVLFDLANTRTRLAQADEDALFGSILLLISEDISSYKTYLDDVSTARLKELLYKLDLSTNETLRIHLKTRALIAIGSWKLNTLDNPYKSVDVLTANISQLVNFPEVPSSIMYIKALDVLADALLQSNKLLTSLYTRQLIVRELSNTASYDATLAVKNYSQIAYLYQKQNNPDSMWVYANKALALVKNNDNDINKVGPLFLIADWCKDYTLDLASADEYLNTASQIMIENGLSNNREVIDLVTKQMQISTIDKKKRLVNSINQKSFELASRLALSYDNADKLTAITFFLELIIAAESNGDFSEISDSATYLKAFEPYFKSLEDGSIPWSFNAFLILNTYGKAIKILNQNNSPTLDIEPFIRHVDYALKAYFTIRSDQVIRENLLYLGHNVSELLRTTSDIYYALSKQVPENQAKQDALNKSFVFADMNKAQLQIEQLVLTNGINHPAISSTLRAEYAKINQEAELLRASVVQKPDYTKIEKLITLEKSRTTLNAEIDNLNPKWNSILLNTDEYLNQITNLLNNETSAIIYNIKDGDGRIFIVDQDGVNVVPVRYAENFMKLTSELKKGLLDNAPDVYQKVGEELSAILLTPVKDYLKKRVLIIPNEEVSKVPFAMLPYDQNSLLIDNHILSIAPSLRVVTQEKKDSEKPEKRFTSVIPVTFDKYFKNETVTVDQRVASNLPYSFLEGQRIAEIIKENNSIFSPFNYYRVKEFSGITASRANFMSKYVTDAEFVHIATHAHTDASNPENTKLLLNSEVSESDASLMLRDIYYLQLKANLLVLNGCETGSGKVITGEGILGITHAFLLSGVKNIIGTLWPVKDKAAAIFMEMYYQELFRMSPEERDYALALQQAMIKMKQSPEFSNPINWSNFYCINSYGTLSTLAN
jgi:CHAT domain-containing protein